MLAEDGGGNAYRKEFYDGYARRQLQENLVQLVRALPSPGSA